MATTFRNARGRVTINGIEYRTTGGRTSVGLRGQAATANIRFAAGQPRPNNGDRVTVELGYRETGIQVAFVGFIDDRSLDLWPNNDSVACTGYLGRLQFARGAEDPSADPDPDTGERPAYQASGKTDDQIARDLLDLWGIPYADIQGDTPPQTFGNVKPVTLGKDEAPDQFLQELGKATFMGLFDGPDGFARRLPISGIPSAPALTLREGVSLLPGTSRTESRRGIANRIRATGLPDAGGPGLTPRAERFADSGYIPTPPRYVAEPTFATNLFETEEQCDTYCSRRLGVANRLVETVPVRLDRCMPHIYPAMSVALDAPHLGYSSGTIFFVEQVDHDWDQRGIHTGLSLLAAAASEGVSPNQAPIALIALAIEIETLGDGSAIWVVYADGRASYDPDGVAIDLDPQHGIATYAWSGDPHGPATPAGLPQATYVYTADPTGATITLTVADTSLKLGSATVTLTADLVAAAGRRDLWGAVEADLLFTANGGQTWQSVGIAAVGCCHEAHPLYQFAWEAGGAFWRVAVDNAGRYTKARPATAPANATAADINLGPDGAGTGRCWIGCADGAVHLSTDDGLTWAQTGTIAPPAGSSGTAVRAIQESPFSFGSVKALCGDAEMISYDQGVSWAALKTYPDAALDAVALASGRFADLSRDVSFTWIVWRGTSANTSSRIHEEADAAAVDWPSAAKPAQPTGLTLGIAAPELYAIDTGGPDGGRSWRIDDFTGGGTLVQKAWDYGAHGAPHDIVRDGTFDGILYLAATDALVKSIDKLETTMTLKGLTSPQVGRMIGFGRLRAPLAPRGNVVWSAAGPSNTSGARYIITWDDQGFHRIASPLDGLGDDSAICSLVATTGAPGGAGRALITYAWVDGRGAAGATNAYRSTDNGATWTPLTVANVYNVVPASGGVVYLTAQDTLSDYFGTHGLYRSTDNGATWSRVYTIGPSATIPAAFGALNVSPIDNDVVLTKGFWIAAGGTRGGFKLSTDGGATFADMEIPSGDQAGLEKGEFVGIAPSGGFFYWVPRSTVGLTMQRATLAVSATAANVPTGPTDHAGPYLNYLGVSYYYGFDGVLATGDQGATWAATLDVARGFVSGSRVQGFVPGDDANGWAALPYGGGVALLVRASDAVATAGWQDLTADLTAAFPDGQFWCYRQGAVRL